MLRISQPQVPPSLIPLDDLVTQLNHDESLVGISIRDQDISGTRAHGASIVEARLDKLIAAEADLEKLGLSDVICTHGTLTATNCADASWRRVAFNSMRCSGLKLQTSTLKDVTFDSCKLDLANFRFSTVKNVLFKDCILDEADFYNATLEHVTFQNCSLDKTQFSSAKCRAVDLRTSAIEGIQGITGLAGTTIDSVQLVTISHILAQHLNIRIADE